MTRKSLITTLALAAVCFPGAASAQAPLRIGVFDSRAVALAWARSPEVSTYFSQLRADYEQARQANDAKRMKELDQEAQWQQIRLHQMGFSTGPVGAVLEKVKDKLPGIARQERVVMIVSRWELPYADPAIEQVDVTLALVKLFNPDEQTLKMIGEMKNQPPIPFAELPLDPKM
jgi:hypothetical protein